MRLLTLPLPGDRFMSSYVIASCWLRDDPSKPLLALVLLLGDAPPYYTVAEIAQADHPDHQWSLGVSETFTNINHAVNNYANLGGDV